MEPPQAFKETCAFCGESFSYPSQDWATLGLNWHRRVTGHDGIQCTFADCDELFSCVSERIAHEKRPHVADHGRLRTLGYHDCIECETSFRSKAELLRHGKEQQHQPFGCKCGGLYSRLDVLNRHLEAFDTSEPKYPCTYCRNRRGPDGFRRRDHLMQHLRNYHHHEITQNTAQETESSSRLRYYFPVCPHPQCPKYRDETFKSSPRAIQQQTKPFSTQSAYTKHMRDEHNECAFPCDVVGCDRVGRRGYFREKDLLKHRRDQHEDAPPYEVAKRELRIRCTELGCNAVLEPSSMAEHVLNHEWYEWENERRAQMEARIAELNAKGVKTSFQAYLGL